MTTLPPAPTYFHKPVSALNAHDAAVVRPAGLQVAELRGRDRHRDRPHLPQHLARRGGRLHPRLHRSATTTGCTTSATPTPGRCCGSRAPTPCARSGPGVVEGWDFRGKQIRTLVNGEVRQDGNTDEMEWDMHYLVADIARTITLQPGDLLLSGHAGDLAHRLPRRRRRGRGRGPRHAAQPHRRRARPRSAPTSARSRRRARRSSPPPRAATGSSAASASPTAARTDRA